MLKVVVATGRLGGPIQHSKAVSHGGNLTCQGRGGDGREAHEWRGEGVAPSSPAPGPKDGIQAAKSTSPVSCLSTKNAASGAATGNGGYYSLRPPRTFFPATPRPGETPRVNPSVGLLSDGAVLGCQPWLPTACSALRSSAHSQAQLAKEARGQENRLLGWNRRERQGCWGRGRETMWLCVPAAGAVSWLFPHSHPKALPSTSTLCLGKGKALPHTLVRCGFPPPPLGWESEEEGRKEMFLIMGLQVTSS